VFWVRLNKNQATRYIALFLLNEAYLWNPVNSTFLQVLIEGGWIVSHFDLALTNIEEGITIICLLIIFYLDLESIQKFPKQYEYQIYLDIVRSYKKTSFLTTVSYQITSYHPSRKRGNILCYFQVLQTFSN
jgi:hypothetical protein